MKNKLYAAGLVLLLLPAGCDVLEQTPQGQISTSQAFANENAANGALNGLYNQVQAVYDWRVQCIGDLASDITQSVDTWDAFINIDEYVTTRDNSEIEDLYTVLYRAVNQANAIVAEVPRLNLLPEKENDLLGQAYLVRGLMYFELARFWGGIPGVYGQWGVVIRTTPSSGIDDGSFGARASLADTYAQVRSDAENALALLPETRNGAAADRGRVVKSTARAVLSRLHLYLRAYALSEQYASLVIADDRYRLVTPYETIFRTKNTAESVFEVQYGVNDVSGMRNWYYPALAGGRGGLALHDAFYQELTANPDDARGRLTAYNANGKVYYPTKYNTPGNSDNTHVIRIAELYLNRAEARAQLGNLAGAAADLNAVRQRAGLAQTAASTREELLDAIMQERKLEFFQEGHRWFDLVRTGKAVEVLTNLKRNAGSRAVSLATPARQVFPFPTSEVLTNPNLEQNEAYR
jgi:hypothetical protein